MLHPSLYNSCFFDYHSICFFLFLHRVFDWLDKNSDGTVDFNEFLFSFAVNGQVVDCDERLELIFDVYTLFECFLQKYNFFYLDGMSRRMGNSIKTN